MDPRPGVALPIEAVEVVCGPNFVVKGLEPRNSLYVVGSYRCVQTCRQRRNPVSVTIGAGGANIVDEELFQGDGRLQPEDIGNCIGGEFGADSERTGKRHRKAALDP